MLIANLYLTIYLKILKMMVSYSFNMIAIIYRRPKLVGIFGIFDTYIAHVVEIITRRSKFDLENSKLRMHIVDGYLKSMSILDEVIACI